MGSQIVFVVVVLLLSVSVQFLTALEDCPDNKDYKFVVDQLFGRSTRRKRQITWSVDCAIASIHEMPDGPVILHKRYECCRECEKLLIRCRLNDIDFLCKKRALECSCSCRALYGPRVDSNLVDGVPSGPSRSNSIPPLRIRKSVKALGFKFPYEIQQQARANEDWEKETCFRTDCSRWPYCCRRRYCTEVIERNSPPDTANEMLAAREKNMGM